MWLVGFKSYKGILKRKLNLFYLFGFVDQSVYVGSQVLLQYNSHKNQRPLQQQMVWGEGTSPIYYACLLLIRALINIFFFESNNTCPVIFPR